jgi:hypothetical protein
VEWLVVRAASWSEADLEFWAVKGRDVGDEVGDFWRPDAIDTRELVSADSFARKEDVRVRESQLRAFLGDMVGQHIRLDHERDICAPVTEVT